MEQLNLLTPYLCFFLLMHFLHCCVYIIFFSEKGGWGMLHRALLWLAPACLGGGADRNKRGVYLCLVVLSCCQQYEDMRNTGLKSGINFTSTYTCVHNYDDPSYLHIYSFIFSPLSSFLPFYLSNYCFLLYLF